MKLFYLIPFLICPLLSAAQNWAPDSAVWHFDHAYFAVRGYVKIHVDGDSVINGQQVRVLRKHGYYINLSTGLLFDKALGSEYTYEDSNRVYFYRYGKFYVLYDFNANAGDSWAIPGDSIASGNCDTIDTVRVDSTGSRIVNNDTLKLLYLNFDHGSNWQFTGDIIKRIGSLGYMFPETFCVSDSHEGGPLRCYRDQEIGFFQTNITACEFLPTSIEPTERSELIIYPIPARDLLTIEMPEYHFTSLAFFDIAGRQVLNFHIEKGNNKITIDVKDLPAGVYNIVFTGDDAAGTISKKVIIK